MESDEKVAIKLSKLKIILLIVGSSAFVVGGAWLLNLDLEVIESARRMNPTLIKGVGIASVGFFGLCGVYGIAKLFDSKPGLILDPTGLTDNSSAVAAGPIPWDEIQGFSEFESHGQKMLVVLVKEPDKYVAVGNPTRRALNKANLKMVGSPISISSNSLQISHAQLTDICMKFHKRYGCDA